MTGHPSLVLMITINVQRYLSFIIYVHDYDDNILVNDDGGESQRTDQLVISTRLINIILIEKRVVFRV